MEPINPVLQGITTAMSLADLMRRQRQDDQRIALEERRVADAEDYQRRQQEQGDLATKLQLQGMGAREATPADLAEANIGYRTAELPGLPSMDGLPSGPSQTVQVPSDIKGRMVKAGGSQYVLPTDEELAARGEKRMTAEELAKTRAARAAHFQALADEGGGVKLDDDVARLNGLPIGYRVLQADLPGYIQRANEIQQKNRMTLKPGEKVVELGADGKPKTVAEGGAPLPTDDFGKYFLPAFAKEKEKKVEDLTFDEVSEARSEFSGENRNPTEAALAWKAVHGKNELERKQADAALRRLDESKRASRPVTNVLMGDQGKAMIEAAAQSLAKGDLTRIKDIAGTRSGERLLIYNRAKELNPKFDPSEVDRKIKMEDYYANGRGASNLQSFGTFLEHGGSASDAVNQIRSTNSKVINKPLNWWRANMSGDPAYINLIGALEPVRKEFEGFLLGGRALYGDDRKAAETILSDNASPAQLQAALKRMGHTAEARFTEENFRYKKVMGKDLQDPFSPEAIEGAKRIGIKLPTSEAAAAPAAGGQITVTDPQGGVHVFANQADAAKFKKLARIE